MSITRQKDLEAYIDQQVIVNEQASATGDITSESIDTQDYDSCVFILDQSNGTAGDNFPFSVQESSDDGSSDAYADVSGLSDLDVTGAEGEGTVAVICQETERYLQVKSDSGEQTLSSTLDLAITVILGGADELPV